MNRPRTNLYSVHPSVATARAIIDNLPGKTGRSLDNWIRLVKKRRKDRITHQIPVKDASDIDDELWEWFEIAYNLDA